MADRIKPIVVLGVVCLVSAYLLGKVYSVTQKKIEEEKALALSSALSFVLPNAVRFEKVEENLWLGYNEGREKVGLVFQTFPRGYGGPIGILCGIDTSGQVVGIRIAGPSEGFKETPGLGSKIREDKFLSQFIGKGRERIRLQSEGGEIAAVTAATISSRAVCEGIREGIRIYEEYLK
ncbi:MAG: RnfABCDGE type electron transport complex subunit G [candidate division WOR-3 bacterium]